MSVEEAILIVNANLHGDFGEAVVQEAMAAGFELELNEEGRLDLADACALVDWESMGGQNIFGCDHGDVGDVVPYCRQPVTRGRVQKLISQRGYDIGQAKMNGIGLTQLTYYSIVLDAEDRGGVHLPYVQCAVGFEILRDNVDAVGYLLGIAAYNAGISNAQLGVENGYFAKVMDRRKKWVKLLGGLEEEDGTTLVDGYEVREIKVDPVKGWATDKKTDLYLAAPGYDTEKFETVGSFLRYSGTLTPEPEVEPEPEPEIIIPSKWRWPRATAQPGDLGDGSYLDLHPTRYETVWREDIEELARWVWDEYGLWCNTYIDHPPGFGGIYDSVSMDIWGPAGRGDGSQADWVNSAFYHIFNNGLPPWIRWCIRDGWIWIDDGYGWREYWDTNPWSDGVHRQHGHITFY